MCKKENFYEIIYLFIFSRKNNFIVRIEWNIFNNDRIIKINHKKINAFTGAINNNLCSHFFNI